MTSLTCLVARAIVRINGFGRNLTEGEIVCAIVLVVMWLTATLAALTVLPWWQAPLVLPLCATTCFFALWLLGAVCHGISYWWSRLSAWATKTHEKCETQR